MLAEHLYGADVDHIQETLFRASRLRQIIGGSRLIAEFGNQAEALAKAHGATEVLIKAGGSFRAIFPTPEQAKAFGHDLADCYREALDASLTLAGEAVELKGDFKKENEQVHQAIQRRKRAERERRASAQTPTTAFCQYSGTGLAGELASRPNENRRDYVSSAVDLMRWAGERARDEGEESFLGMIAKHLPDDLPKQWPDGEKKDGLEKIESLDAEHSNVAYLLADANGMGKLFSKCDSPEQLKELSEALDHAMREAVAAPISDLYKRLKAEKQSLDYLPVLPLILAGDDAFVLLPAYYALDYARRFCLAFESAMLKYLSKPIAPTIGATVVICKGHFPYRIAYERGKARLNEAKRLSKSLAQATENADRLSAINFEMITGNELIGQPADAQGDFRAELRPYWAKDELSVAASSYGISLLTLLSQRLDLKDTPGKRLAELRELYAPEALSSKEKEYGDTEQSQNNWELRLKHLMERMDATEQGSSQSVLWALQKLGDEKQKSGDSKSRIQGYWRMVQRSDVKQEEEFRSNGLPDLIEVWDYAQRLDREIEDYEPENSRKER
jgi:CRISPR/Cas system-associated protein Cas10 (large subunit of type III CRISPR-Cas system)